MWVSSIRAIPHSERIIPKTMKIVEFICLQLIIAFGLQVFAFPVSEYLALEDIYDSLHGDYWLWRDESDILADDDYILNLGFGSNYGTIWNFTGYHDPCQEGWQGINCTCSNSTNSLAYTYLGTNCTVVSLELAYFNLTGTLPLTISNLENLRVLYLNYNNITGRIPVTLGELSDLRFLSLANNDLVSQIPSSIGNCSQLLHLHLEYNEITGTIPDELYDLTNLNYLNLEYNNLHGSLSPRIGRLSKLMYLHLNNNNFDGTIPMEIGQCSRMLELELYENYFSGNISDAFMNMTRLNYFYLYHNEFTGTIPSWIGTKMRVFSFDAGYNQLTGSLPETLCSKRSTLVGLFVNSNQLVGTIPSCFGGNQSILAELLLSTNFLTGTVPTSFSESFLLKGLFVSGNFLSGTLPSVYSGVLEVLYVESNMFSGNLYNVLNDGQRKVAYLDFSDNQLTGSIPDSFYGLKDLRSIAMVSNCITGSISDKLCNLELLQYVDFDGLHTATSCQRRILPLFDSYLMDVHIIGTLPPCMFSLPIIESIHISGNDIESTLPYHVNISNSLYDITLSHNMLKGTIPITMQTRAFKTLDLSYNCFNGGLHPDFNVSGETYLQVNRISGPIPAVFRHALNVSILDGNLFSCDLQKSSLPLNDPEYGNYECGSNTFNQSVIIWLIFVFPVAILIAGGYWSVSNLIHGKPNWLRLQYWEYIAYFQLCIKVYQTIPDVAEQNDIVEFGLYLNRLRATFVKLTMAICIGMLPLYLLLSKFYATHSHEYAWNASCLYLSGETPAVILMIVFLILLLVIFLSMRKILWRWLRKEIFIDFATSSETKVKMVTYNRRRILLLCFVATMNCAMMVVLNGVYVYFVFEYSSGIVFLCQLIISVFKIVWNEYALTWLVHTSRVTAKIDIVRPISGQFLPTNPIQLQRTVSIDSDRGAGLIHHCSMDAQRDLAELKEKEDAARLEEAQDMPVLTFIVIFNTIIAPVIANSILSEQCFQSVFLPPAKVTSDNSYSVCQQQHTFQLTNVLCLSQSSRYLSTSYDPPFIYRYGCSSAFINNYASVFVYMFLLTGIGKPVGFMLWKYIYETTKFYRLRKLMSAFLNKLLKEKEFDISRLQSSESLFRKERFVLNNVSATCVLMTVGVVFPPLAVIVLLAIFSHTYMNQFIIGRFVTCFSGVTQELVVKRLCEDLKDVALLFKHSLLFMIPFVSCFYAFYLIDIYGDATNWRKAMWVAVVLFVMPLFGFVVYQLYRVLYAINKQRIATAEAKAKLDKHRAKSIAELSRASYYNRRSSAAASFDQETEYQEEDGDVEDAVVIENPIGKGVEMTPQKSLGQ